MPELPELSYVRPRNLTEALAALAKPHARAYAGGTDLLVDMMARKPAVAAVRELVDIKDLDEAKSVDDRGEYFRVGALVTAAELAAEARVRNEAPALAEAAARTSAPALRRRGTVGGNIVAATAASDMTTALLAFDSTVELADTHGVQEVELGAFLGQDLARGCVVLALHVRKRPRSAFEKFAMRDGFGRSLVSVAVAIEDKAVAISVGGLAERPFRSAAAEAAVAGATSVAEALAIHARSPRDGVAGESYRIGLADTLIRRALAKAEGR